ncbi:mucin-5B [Heterocephalus glaber]|uniref:Mucin-2 n=1 Tax=Heterocephalus glaber TaxID=10181 RepID=A0AAX6TDX9_HETGA|nr:mucin-5B [Heterocephalus glaber]
MGTRSRSWALAWALVALLVVRLAETQTPAELSLGNTEPTSVDSAYPTASPARRLTFIPPLAVFPSVSPLNPAHTGRVCSTWGDFHYKTFDGAVFRFPGLCNYVFSSHCGAAYEDFNVQLRRGLAGSRPTITHVVLKAQGLVLELSNGSVLVDGQREDLPYSRAGLLVEQSSDYVKVNVRLVLTFLWNGEDSALLELDPKFANQTCGLCGDFNGLPDVGEFYVHNARLSPLQFGNLQKLDGPTEQCQDPLPSPPDNCTDGGDFCRRILFGPAFTECNGLVDASVYAAACAQDLCRCPTCPCATFAEYSRQCAHGGGQPQNWRGPDLCPPTCAPGMQHQECGSPCTDTCSNPQRSQLCEDHCVDGCFCPPGTVLDDITHAGCVPLPQCPCTHAGRTFAPGTSFTTSCSSCTCSEGLWQCQEQPCPGTCSVRGGSHISTYDEKLYDVHGDCSYVLSKRCTDSTFTVLAELRKCGLTDTENCLKAVTLSLNDGNTAIRVQASGAVFMNSIYTRLPVSAANITVFKPSSFFILVETGLGLQLQVQLVPLMQVHIALDPLHHGQMCGLCGNFNQNQADDFTALSGVVEGTGAAFANTWKTQASCPNAKNSFEDPCSLSVENENYAQHWCALLMDPAGVFSACHSSVNPEPFHSNCMFDTCNCERSEDCLCAALSSYVHACAAKGVLLRGWRDGVCTKYMSSCPKSQSYAYVLDACQPTCRGLSEADVTCGVSFVPVDGCACPAGTFLDEAGTCVPAHECPCYLRGSVVAPGEVVQDDGVVCSCASGKLSCLGALLQSSPGCAAPMVYLDCSNASAGTPGAECLRSCHTLDVECFSTHCISGCVCPPGLVSDGRGGCVAAEDCPCMHNEASYRPGETIRVGCNTCTCRNRRWECSSRPCLGTCVAYGDGHFITFDGERYSFGGSCEYTLAQDYCRGNGSAKGTFRIVTENVPCGTTGTTCSKAIKIFVESYELILHEGGFKVVERGQSSDLPYKVRYMGIFLVIETRSGMAVSWDRKTSVFIRLPQSYKGRVCGLCGNFDDNAINDLTTRSQAVVSDALEFGNSWKFSPTCPDARAPQDPCTANPYRKGWAQRQCSIINSATFAACRSQVDSTKYYEACVRDACACDSGGDCECFCTAVAAYAQACHDVGVCVSWRTPDICPLFCDYYNPTGECEWHYQPCGAPCLRTCRNPSGRCLVDLPGLEGCYPKCPPSQPFFSEDQMQCVAQCGCYSEDGKYYDIEAQVPTAENCQRCRCTPDGLQCTHSLEACTCTYEDRTYSYGDLVYNTTDGLGACLTAICGDNGTLIRRVVECPGTPSTTPFTFTTTSNVLPTTGSVPTASTVCVRKVCRWSPWLDGDHPEPGMGGGDFEMLTRLREQGYPLCLAPAAIECRAEQFPGSPLQELGQKVDCDPAKGLICLNSEQSPPLCHNYQLRVLCCDPVPCSSSPAPPTSTTTLTTPWALSSPTLTSSSRGITTSTALSSLLTTELTLQTRSRSSATPKTDWVSSTLAPSTSTCRPQCQWTEWFDVDYPKSERAGGDMETYERIRAAGGALCPQPEDIECRAQNYPSKTPEELGQHVHCNLSFGLVCHNQEQEGVFHMCYNYRIRVLCCDDISHCKSLRTNTPMATTLITASNTQGTATTTVSTATTPLTTTQETATTTLRPATTPLSTTQKTATTTQSTATTPLSTTQETATTTLSTTQETATTTVSTTQETATTTLSTTQETATTTLRMVTTTPLSTTQKTATTTVSTATTTPLNTTQETVTTTLSTATTPLSTTEEIATTRVSTATTTPLSTTQETATTTLRTATSKLLSTTQKPATTTVRTATTTPLSTTQETVTTTVSSTQETATSTLSTATTTPLSTTEETATTTLSTATTPLTASIVPTQPLVTSLVQTTTTHRPSTPYTEVSTRRMQTSLGTTTEATTRQGTTGCQPKCQWTEWFDVDFPTSGVPGGDVETYDNIRAAGGKMCLAPEKIECRAENYPEVSIDQIGQVVVCSLQTGLVCRNEDQTGMFTMCFNYNVRVLCCDRSHCPTMPSPTFTLWPSLYTQTLTTLATSRWTGTGFSTETSTWRSASLPITSESPSVPPASTSSLPHTSAPWTPWPLSSSASSAVPVTSHPLSTLGTTPVLTTTAGPPPATGSFRPPASTPGTVPTSGVPTSSLLTSSVSAGPSSSLTTLGPTASSTQLCFCWAFGQLFSPGDVIYNKTDRAGCHFSAICNQHCDIDRFQGTCPTSQPPMPSTSVASPSPLPGCDNAVPPRQVNESWTLDNCTVARCEGDNHVVLLPPEPVANVSCVNKHLPIRVWHEHQPCHSHYECECSCSGWGHSHYSTFDGTTYSFPGNCTYILVKEIHPRHGNLSILLHSHYCATGPGASCPRALQVLYLSMDIILTTADVGGVEQSLVLFNGVRVSGPLSKDGVSLSVTAATNMHIDIPAIGVSISFSGRVFQVRLSYSHFSHNTEGQCGTCTNSQSDDCRRPDGTMAPTCKDMAPTWLVPGSSGGGCRPPTSPPPSASPLPPVPSISTATTSTPCAPGPLCKLLLSSVFAECHALVPPDSFFSSCISDHCQAGDREVPCQSLAAYAALCRARGVCIDWRNATSGLCELSCPASKVYKPCGPMHSVSCDSRNQSPLDNGLALAEGCFCPGDQLLFSSHMDICVPECPCVGPDGLPKFPGQRWVSDCQACVCDMASVSVQCSPVQCKAQGPAPPCEQHGFVLVTRPQAHSPCCPETLCVCNVSTCLQAPPTCPPGQELIPEEGHCCPTFRCQPRLCEYNGTIYGVGATFPALSPCHTCTCLSGPSQEPVVQCEERTCSPCPQGFVHSRVSGQCCGNCVQAACFTPEGQIVQPNETWVDNHVNNCTKYLCEAQSGVPVLTPQPVSCQDVSLCRGILRRTGCCYTCETEEDACQVHANVTVLRHQGCEAVVTVTFCEGSCPGVSKYSMEAQTVQHQCSCCQESSTHQQAVTLQCPDGTAIWHTYTQVDACSCTTACRPWPMSPRGASV